MWCWSCCRKWRSRCSRGWACGTSFGRWLAGCWCSSGCCPVAGCCWWWVRCRGRCGWRRGVWERYGFRRVSYTRQLSRSRAFTGDTLEYTIALSNDKMLPLIWVEAQDPFPEGLELVGASVRGESLETNRHHSITASLLPYQRATWKFDLRCRRRGYHRIGPVRMRSGDIFGFTSSEIRHSGVDNLLVYPRVVDLESLLAPPRHPFGLARGRGRYILIPAG